jgi:acyl-homoserine-lactone acylase
VGAQRTAGDGSYEAEIRYTTHGVPHVRAASWGSLGFGQGWACAADHLGTIVDQICKVRGHRARHLGAGDDDVHLESDVAYSVLDLQGRAGGALGRLAPHAAALVEGYAAGVNACVEQGVATLPAWCGRLAAVLPVDAVDVLAYAGDLARAASGRNLVVPIARARPPGPDGPAPMPPLSVIGASLASNGWAVGRARTASGHGIVVANPHFPWYGEARFWECHLTLPGELDVYGVALLGTPGVQIGFNRHVAWAHTFSIGKRFALYRLELEPGNPTRYRTPDGWEDCTEEVVTVDVRDGDDLGSVQRRMWRSRYGPMLNLPILGWTDAFGFSYRDANDADEHMLTQWLAMDAAGGIEDLQDAFRRENGIPWCTTLAADVSGKVWYVDASHTPNLPPEGIDRYRAALAGDPLVKLLDENRVALLDAADAACEWLDEPGAAGPGLVPLDRLPQLERDDWVANANGAHWLTNPVSPLTGYSPLVGVEGEAPSARTRAGFAALNDAGSGPDGRLTMEDLAARVLSNRSVLADVLCPEVAARCRAAGTVTVGGTAVDVAAAATVLEAWDHTYDLDARGAVLWRETMAALPKDDLRRPGSLFAEPFSIEAPFDTPRTPAPAPADGPDPVVTAVARAVLALRAAGVDTAARLGDVQWVMRGSRRIPVHGGQECDGVANVLEPIGELPSTSLEPGEVIPEAIAGIGERTGLRRGGYQCTYGTSFLMVVELGESGPRAQGLLAYGQSGDAASEHHADQVEEYSAKRLRPLRYEDADIAADPSLRTVVIRSG